MSLNFDPINLFYTAQKNGYFPALLESHGIKKHYCNLSALGFKPIKCLEVKNDALFLNQKKIGKPLDIFNYFTLPASDQFFPAWIGFFSYEFAKYLHLPTKALLEEIPQACFFFYEEGFRWESGLLAEKPKNKIKIEPKIISDIPLVNLHSNFKKKDFLSDANIIKDKIRNGDVYQVNLSKRFHFACKNIDPISVYAHLTKKNPSPFMGIMGHKDWHLISGSPERLFRYDQNQILTRPIAGTRPRGQNNTCDNRYETELKTNPKERAEHAMLVDLLRNDLAKVSKPGSTEITEAFSVERYSHVMHMVSEIKSISNASLKNVFKSIFPGGTITGTPKESAMQCIAELEPVPRGPYTGSMGYISSGFGADFNILIRSLVLGKKRGFFSTGAGIVIESDPKKEYEEISQKAKGLKHVLKCAKKGATTMPVRIFSSWKPETPTKYYHAHIGFIENHDSFSFNIVDYFHTLGCKVTVIDHSNKPDLKAFSHLVLGPGPKEPNASGQLMSWLDEAMKAKKPLLGICLGHQALGLYCGAKLIRAQRPIHGEVEYISHDHLKIFKNIPNPLQATRYHSLILNDLPNQLEILAETKEKEIMAVAHKTHPAFGIQFHPESFLSQYGLQLLGNFIDETRT